MNEFRNDTYCGLYCGACDMQLAYRQALERGVTATWDGINFPLRDRLTSAPIVCHGCKTDSVFRGCAICPIRKCGRAKPELETCLDCRRYPCLRHSLLNLFRRITGLSRKLPHLSVIPVNLQAIRERGVAAWLQEQQQRWVCPSCSAAFSWYQEQCAGCGHDLKDLKGFSR